MHAVACLFSRLKGAIRDFIHCQMYGDEKKLLCEAPVVLFYRPVPSAFFYPCDYIAGLGARQRWCLSSVHWNSCPLPL